MEDTADQEGLQAIQQCVQHLVNISDDVGTLAALACSSTTCSRLVYGSDAWADVSITWTASWNWWKLQAAAPAYSVRLTVAPGAMEAFWKYIADAAARSTPERSRLPAIKHFTAGIGSRADITHLNNIMHAIGRNVRHLRVVVDSDEDMHAIYDEATWRDAMVKCMNMETFAVTGVHIVNAFGALSSIPSHITGLEIHCIKPGEGTDDLQYSPDWQRLGRLQSLTLLYSLKTYCRFGLPYNMHHTFSALTKLHLSIMIRPDIGSFVADIAACRQLRVLTIRQCVWVPSCNGPHISDDVDEDCHPQFCTQHPGCGSSCAYTALRNLTRLSSLTSLCIDRTRCTRFWFHVMTGLTALRWNRRYHCGRQWTVDPKGLAQMEPVSVMTQLTSLGVRLGSFMDIHVLSTLTRLKDLDLSVMHDPDAGTCTALQPLQFTCLTRLRFAVKHAYGRHGWMRTGNDPAFVTLFIAWLRQLLSSSANMCSLTVKYVPKPAVSPISSLHNLRTLSLKSMSGFVAEEVQQAVGSKLFGPPLMSHHITHLCLCGTLVSDASLDVHLTRLSHLHTLALVREGVISGKFIATLHTHPCLANLHIVECESFDSANMYSMQAVHTLQLLHYGCGELDNLEWVDKLTCLTHIAFAPGTWPGSNIDNDEVFHRCVHARKHLTSLTRLRVLEIDFTFWPMVDALRGALDKCLVMQYDPPSWKPSDNKSQHGPHHPFQSRTHL